MRGFKFPYIVEKIYNHTSDYSDDYPDIRISFVPDFNVDMRQCDFIASSLEAMDNKIIISGVMFIKRPFKMVYDVCLSDRWFTSGGAIPPFLEIYCGFELTEIGELDLTPVRGSSDGFVSPTLRLNKDFTRLVSNSRCWFDFLIHKDVRKVAGVPVERRLPIKHIIEPLTETIKSVAEMYILDKGSKLFVVAE